MIKLYKFELYFKISLLEPSDNIVLHNVQYIILALSKDTTVVEKDKLASLILAWFNQITALYGVDKDKNIDSI